MLGCRSLSLPLITCDLNIERTFRWLGEHTTKTMGDPLALRGHYLPTTFTSP